MESCPKKEIPNFKELLQEENLYLITEEGRTQIFPVHILLYPKAASSQTYVECCCRRCCLRVEMVFGGGDGGVFSQERGWMSASNKNDEGLNQDESNEELETRVQRKVEHQTSWELEELVKIRGSMEWQRSSWNLFWQEIRMQELVIAIWGLNCHMSLGRVPRWPSLGSHDDMEPSPNLDSNK
ncbi:Uncharacterized protein Fot_12795 [Forsythia ovata]|uniref:Uncharacterized protein n=1 Tax=Forsythia ovata TaxID=205694 RepID=A0ABD1W1Z5_9LAMI